ncbi:MAG: SIMPL domain-containing protein [Pirellula sp.]|nr:SIMPL domain-containing protein [Pirellula sp.]
MLLYANSLVRFLKQFRSIALATFMSGVACDYTFGQFDMGAITRGISATGVASESIKPKTLRLVMQVSAKAKDAKKSIEELAIKKNELKKAFEEMKANVATLQFSDAKLTEEIAGSSANGSSSAEMQMVLQMQRQMQRQMGGKGGDSDAADLGTLPTAFTSECQLRVDWDLPENIDSDVITLLKSRLEGEVKKRDLLKAGGGVELSDEEKESLELFQSQSQGGYSSYSRSNQDFGSKIFIVGVVSDQITDKLSKQAFEKAVARANRISESTGVKKGDIVGVSFTGNQIDMMEPYRYMSRNFLYEDQAPDTSFMAPGEDEVLGTKPSDLKKTVSAVVVYDIVK